VVNLAVNIEEDGLAFYKALAEGATDPQAKAVFLPSGDRGGPATSTTSGRRSPRRGSST
jgi:hypothetical protein